MRDARASFSNWPPYARRHVHIPFDARADLIDSPAEVPAVGIGRDHYAPAHILAIDGVRSRGVYHVGHASERNHPAGGAYGHVLDVLFGLAPGVVELYRDIAGDTLLEHLRDNLSSKHNPDIFGEFPGRDPVPREKFPARTDIDLRPRSLLLDVDVDNALGLLHLFLYFQSRGIEPVKIVAENLYSNLGLAAGEHGVDTVGNRLPYLDIHSGELTQFLTQLVGDFTPCPAMVQRVWHLEFRDVYAQGVLVKFGSARLAGHPLYLRYRHDDALGLAAHGIALVERYSRQRAEIDGKRSFIERGQETSAQREEQCDADRKESTGAPEDYFRMGQRGTQGARIEGTEFTRQPGRAPAPLYRNPKDSCKAQVSPSAPRS